MNGVTAMTSSGVATFGQLRFSKGEKKRREEKELSWVGQGRE
jgi:hypothetical protein